MNEQELFDSLRAVGRDVTSDGADLNRVRRGIVRRRRLRISAASGVLALAVTGTAVGLAVPHHDDATIQPISPPTGVTGRPSTPAGPRPSPTPPPTSAPAATTARASASVTTVPGPPGGPVPAGFRPVSATFVSAGEGFALGTAPCSSAPCTSVLRTVDGGTSWVGIPAPRAALATATTPGLVGLRFADPLDGFAYGGTGIWATHDGGASWHGVTLGGNLGGKTVGSIPTVVAVHGAVFALLLGASDSTTLLRAAAGSDTFVPISGLPQAPAALAPAGADVLATYATETAVVSATGAVRSVDDPAANCTDAASSGTAYLAVCTGTAAGGSSGTRQVFGTTDGGRHWMRLPNPGRGSGYDPGEVAVTADRHAAIATAGTSGSSLLVTTDGGLHWSTALSVAGGQAFTDLGFTTDSQGIAIGVGPPTTSTDASSGALGPTLYLTRDGGVSWSPVSF